MSSYTTSLDPATLRHLLGYTQSTGRQAGTRQQTSITPPVSTNLLDRIRRYFSSPALPNCDLKSDNVSPSLICPLTHQIYEDPIFARCKHVFEKAALQEHLSSYRRCPITACNQVIRFSECQEFPELLQLVRSWIAVNPAQRDPYAPPPLPEINLDNVDVPDEFVCAIAQSGDAMKDPVYTKCKHVFEKANIRKWINDGNNNCPVCRSGVETGQLTRWLELKILIRNWSQRHPTPVDIVVPPQRSSSRGMIGSTVLSRKSPLEIDYITNTFYPAVRALGLLLDCANQIDIGNPRQIVDLGKFLAKYPQRRAYLEPCIKQAYLNVYILHCKQTGKNPTHPKFGEYAFNQLEHLNVSQTVRQDALALSILKTLGILFQYQDQFADVNLLNLFDRLPEKMRKDIYGSTYLFLQAGGSYLDNHPRLGEKAFRRQGEFFATDEERTAAIETYLQSKF